MAEEYIVTLPKLGESIVSATVVQWFKKEGDSIRLDEPLLEVSTDKVNSEIPSPVSGVVYKIVVAADRELQVGEPLAVIHVQKRLESGEESISPAPQRAQVAPGSVENTFFSPALLRMAQEAGLSVDQLTNIPGTGSGGRVTKRDLEHFIQSRKTPTTGPDIERVKMSGLRKAIAENMVRSFYEAPHATLVTEVDVTRVIEEIAREKEAFLAKHGVKLTITTYIARAIAQTLREYPLLNSSLDGDTIVVKRFVNIGIAVSVDQGIVVPVVKNCQHLTLPQLAAGISDLSSRARTGQLKPDDVKDGTVTLTNFGISGVQIGIPIIRHPEVAIIGMGAVQKRVIVVEDDAFAVRSMIYLSLTFDHRVIDGMYGCGFLNALRGHLEKG
jgi:2-oxoglutarate dehydrogenase E2 component (dihydrolipoamide succinyltransferase)